MTLKYLFTNIPHIKAENKVTLKKHSCRRRQVSSDIHHRCHQHQHHQHPSPSYSSSLIKLLVYIYRTVLRFGLQALFPNAFVISCVLFITALRPVSVITSYNLVSSLCLWSLILYPMTAIRKCISAILNPLICSFINFQHWDPYKSIGMTITLQTLSNICYHS